MDKQKILVPLDGSALSEQIFPTLKSLFDPTECHLTLIQILPPLPEFVHQHAVTPLTVGPSTHQEHQFVHSVPVDVDDEPYERQAVDEIEQTAENLRRNGYSVDVTLRRGRVTDAILEYIRLHEIDLVAMMTHGRRGMSRLLLGSVAEEILRNASVPVLLNRPKQS